MANIQYSIKAYRFPIWWQYNSEWQPSPQCWSDIKTRQASYIDSIPNSKLHFINDQQISIILPKSPNNPYVMVELISGSVSYYYHLTKTTRVLQDESREYLGVLNVYMTYVHKIPDSRQDRIKCRVIRFLANYLERQWLEQRFWQHDDDEWFDYKNEPYGLAYDDRQTFSRMNQLYRLNEMSMGSWKYEYYKNQQDINYPQLGSEYGFVTRYRILIPYSEGSEPYATYHNNLLDPRTMGFDVYGNPADFYSKGQVFFTTPAISIINQKRMKLVVYQTSNFENVPEGTFACFYVIDDSNETSKNISGKMSEFKKEYRYFDQWIALKADNNPSNSGIQTSPESMQDSYKTMYAWNQKTAVGSGGKIIITNGRDPEANYSMFIPSIPKLSFFLNQMNTNRIKSIGARWEWQGNKHWIGKLVGIYDVPFVNLMNYSDLLFYGMCPVNEVSMKVGNETKTYDRSYVPHLIGSGEANHGSYYGLYKIPQLFVPSFFLTPSQFKNLCKSSAANPQSDRTPMAEWSSEGLAPLMYKPLSADAKCKILDYRTRYFYDPSYQYSYILAQTFEGKSNSAGNYMEVWPYPELAQNADSTGREWKKLNAYAMSRTKVFGRPSCPRYEWDWQCWYYPNTSINVPWFWFTMNKNEGVGGGESLLTFSSSRFIIQNQGMFCNSWMWESRETIPVATSTYANYVNSVRSQINTGLQVAREQRDFASKSNALQAMMGTISSLMSGDWVSGLLGTARHGMNAMLGNERARLSYKHREMEVNAQLNDKYRSSTAQNLVPSDIQATYLNLINNNTFDYWGSAPKYSIWFTGRPAGNTDSLYNRLEFGIAWFAWTGRDQKEWDGYARFNNYSAAWSPILQPMWTEPCQFPQSQEAINHYERMTWKVGMKGGFWTTLNLCLFVNRRGGSRVYINNPSNDVRSYSSTLIGYPTSPNTYSGTLITSGINPFQYLQLEIHKPSLQQVLEDAFAGTSNPLPEWVVDAVAELFESGVREWNREPTYTNEQDRFAFNFGYYNRYIPVQTLQEGGTADLCSSTSNDSTTSTRSTRRQKSRR